MNIKIAVFILGATILVGCGSTTKPSADSSANCPANVAKFVAGEATSDFVKGCLGKPDNEDYNPDGRYIYLYYGRNGLVFSYLFGSDDKLIKVSGYQDKSRN